MKKMAAIAGLAMSVAAVSLAVAGCGSSNQPAASPPSASSAAGSSSSTAATAKVAARSPAPNPGSNPTIATYIREDGIQETPVHRGDPGAPTINVPTPPGWHSAGDDTPDWAYSAIVSTGPDSARHTPSIVAVMSKLSGNADAQKIIDLAPGELNNLPGYQAIDAGAASSLSGFPAYQLAGTWSDNGQTKVVAQKTVVIPGGDGLYVLQLNADGLQDQADIVSAATNVVDQQTTITR